jgi:hypothetical protein
VPEQAVERGAGIEIRGRNSRRGHGVILRFPVCRRPTNRKE